LLNNTAKFLGPAAITASSSRSTLINWRNLSRCLLVQRQRPFGRGIRWLLDRERDVFVSLPLNTGACVLLPLGGLNDASRQRRRDEADLPLLPFSSGSEIDRASTREELRRGFGCRCTVPAPAS